jgi:hypothetical protein
VSLTVGIDCVVASNGLAERFVDRDMMMQYHLGLGVGHSFSQYSSNGSCQQSEMDEVGSQASDDEDIGLAFHNETSLPDQGGDSSSADESYQESETDSNSSWSSITGDEDEGIEQDDDIDEEDLYME